MDRSEFPPSGVELQPGIEGQRLQVEPPPGLSPFPPIADYGFLSDCHTTALVAPNGNVEWLCLPRMDSPSVFGSILDRDAGGFRLGPADAMAPASRCYLSGTMVLETSWVIDLGNFPQAFTHLALINAVVRVIGADQELADQLGLRSARMH